MRILKVVTGILAIMAIFCFWSDWHLAQTENHEVRLSSIRSLWADWLEAGHALSSRATNDLSHPAALWHRGWDAFIDLPAGPACLGLTIMCGLLYLRTRKRWKFFAGKNR